MWFISSLRNKLAQSAGRAKRSRNRARCRPRLEILEDRSVPSGGVLDPTFGAGGAVTTDVASSGASYGSAVATYPKEGTANDGKIVAAGTFYDQHHATEFAVVRYNLDGSLDPSFGGSGQVTASVGSAREGAGDVIVQPDGKVVVAGWTGGSSSNFALVRYNADGSLDKSFGNKGVVKTNIQGQDYGWVMALQADGKIVVAGTSAGDLAVVRYNTDGSLDTSFGTGGKVTRHFSAPLAVGTEGGIDLAIDPNTNPLDPYAGKIVVAAQLGTETIPPFDSMVVLRLNTNGTPDTSFGSNGAGYVSITTMKGADVAAVAVQSDDRIVVAGTNSVTPPISLARFNPDGTPDATFGSGGFVEVTQGNHERTRSLTLQPDGKIVVAGDTDNFSNPDGSHQFMVVRFNAADGSLDTSFGTGGFAVSTGFNIDVDKVDVALEPDGRIVVAGTNSTGPYGTGHTRFALARFLTAGPQVGSLTVSPTTPMPAGTILTLTASGITDANPGAAVTQVTFYLDSNGDGVLDAGDVQIGQTSSGPWTVTYSTQGLAPGTYKVFAEAQDSYGALGDPFAGTFQVL
jgi:uncharacterized delta-60 repeat protein